MSFDIFGPLPFIGWVFRLIWKYPKITFWPPRQRADRNINPENPNISWWHIPVSFESHKPWHHNRYETCTVHFYISGITNSDGPGIRLWWHTSGDTGEREAVLQHRIQKFASLVRRDELQDDGAAFVTNDDWFTQGKIVHPIAPGRYSCSIKIRQGDVVVAESPGYELKVPNPNISNGHFYLDSKKPGSDW